VTVENKTSDAKRYPAKHRRMTTLDEGLTAWGVAQRHGIVAAPADIFEKWPLTQSERGWRILSRSFEWEPIIRVCTQELREANPAAVDTKETGFKLDVSWRDAWMLGPLPSIELNEHSGIALIGEGGAEGPRMKDLARNAKTTFVRAMELSTHWLVLHQSMERGLGLTRLGLRPKDEAAAAAFDRQVQINGSCTSFLPFDPNAAVVHDLFAWAKAWAFTQMEYFPERAELFAKAAPGLGWAGEFLARQEADALREQTRAASDLAGQPSAQAAASGAVSCTLDAASEQAAKAKKTLRASSRL
jgi:hypothetical protein